MKSPLYLIEKLLGHLHVLWHWHVGLLSQKNTKNKTKNINFIH